MDYIGEHLLPGKIGQFFIVLSLVATLVATISYFLATRSKSEVEAASWKKIARIAFITECISVFAIFGILFFIIYNHLFEYHYAWKHSSRSLELKYLLASFWEGQEGSFLLWSIWHCVLGLVLIRTSKNWESPVMTVVSFVQFCLATMIAGLYVFGEKIGSNPFILLRDSGVLDNAPALHVGMDNNNPLRPDYLLSIKDGNDLNPLLQDYWMVIHPPVLFLGFASTVVPFAFAVAGLWTKKFGGWINQALPWALFSAAMLGIGIMMGAAWAYEALTFGGYWAWDPVENASLVPWLILIAGVHTLLIYKHSGHSLRSTYLFFFLTFGFILYSTFLTRSGILGDSSVHAFTDLGMNSQLYLLLFSFFWLPAVLGAKSRSSRITTMITCLLLLLITYLTIIFPVVLFGKELAPIMAFISLIAGIIYTIYQIQTQVPAVQKEESSSSREFWMFIGSLVFFISSLVIIGKTSLPVLNKILATNFASPDDPEFVYNSIQIYVAIILAVLTGFAQYLKYKDTPMRLFFKKIMIPTVISIVIAVVVLALGDFNYDSKGPMFKGAIWLAVACSIFTIIANASYIWLGLKGKLRLSGGSVSHLGFGLVLLGIMISSSKKETISRNTSGIFVDFGKDSGEKAGENLTLVKGIRNDMGKYWATYISDSAHPKKQQWYYSILFQRKDGKEEFILKPNAFVNYKGNEGLMSKPDSRHYWNHDIFTYVTSLPDPEKQANDTANFQKNVLKKGDSLFYSKGYLIVEDVRQKDSLPPELFGEGGFLYETPLKIYAKTGSTYTVTPRLAFAKGEYVMVPDTITAESLILQLQKVNSDQTIEIGVKESDSVLKYVTLKAYKFPFINMLWLGVIITAIGIFMSMFRRISLNRKTGA